MKRLLLVSTSLLALAVLAGCGIFGDEDNGVTGEIPTIDPTVAANTTVELSGLPPDGTVVIVNGRYYLLWEEAKAPIAPEETTLEALQGGGVTEGEAVPAGPLAVADAPAATPTRWVTVTVEGASEGDPERTVLYLVVGNEARRIQPQPLVGIAEVAIADASDPAVIDRVQFPGGAPATTPSPTQ
jgi:hypothetical protein